MALNRTANIFIWICNEGCLYFIRLCRQIAAQPGDTITLKETYEDKSYNLTVTGIYEYEGALDVFMSREALNDMFDLGSDYFCGYFSNSELRILIRNILDR